MMKALQLYRCRRTSVLKWTYLFIHKSTQQEQRQQVLGCTSDLWIVEEKFFMKKRREEEEGVVLRAEQYIGARRVPHPSTKLKPTRRSRAPASFFQQEQGFQRWCVIPVRALARSSSLPPWSCAKSRFNPSQRPSTTSFHLRWLAPCPTRMLSSHFLLQDTCTLH